MKDEEMKLQPMEWYIIYFFLSLPALTIFLVVKEEQKIQAPEDEIPRGCGRWKSTNHICLSRPPWRKLLLPSSPTTYIDAESAIQHQMWWIRDCCQHQHLPGRIFLDMVPSLILSHWMKGCRIHHGEIEQIGHHREIEQIGRLYCPHLFPKLINNEQSWKL